MYIPDPIEILQSRIENMIDQLDDLSNTYPCAVCEERKDISTMMTLTPAPDSPVACPECIGQIQWEKENPVFGPWPSINNSFKDLPF